MNRPPFPAHSEKILSRPTNTNLYASSVRQQIEEGFIPSGIRASRSGAPSQKRVLGAALAAFSLAFMPASQGQEDWSWTKRDTATDAHLYAISMADQQFGVAVGQRATVLKWDGKQWGPLGGTIVNSTHGESAFPGTPETGGWGEDTEFHAVSTLGPDFVWVGSAGNWSGEGASKAPRGVDFWNGSHWNGSQSSPVGLVSSPAIFSIWSAPSDGTLAAGGAPGRISLFDGTKWSIKAEYKTGFFYSIHGNSNLQVWATGQVDGDDNGVVREMRIVVSNNAGETWDVAPFLEGSSWQDTAWKAVFTLDPSHVWFLGGRNLIGFWNGSEFSVINAKEAGLVMGLTTLNGVFALAPDQVWVVGSDGTILYFDGQEWNPVDSGMVEALNAISGDGQGGLWIAGDSGLILQGKKSGAPTARQ